MTDAESAREEWTTYTKELENALITNISNELPPPTYSFDLDRYLDDDDGKGDTCQNTNGSPEVASARKKNTLDFTEIVEAEQEQARESGRAEQESDDVERISISEEHKNEDDEVTEEVDRSFEDGCEESIAEFGKRMELRAEQDAISADESERNDDDDDAVTTAAKPDLVEVEDNLPDKFKQNDLDKEVSRRAEVIEETKSASDSCATDHSNPSPAPSSTRSGLRRAFDFLKLRRRNKIVNRCLFSASNRSDSRQSALCIIQWTSHDLRS